MSIETSLTLLLLGISVIYFLFPPKRINYIYGYRTKKAMKNIDNWRFANMLAGKILLLFSLLNLILSAIVREVFQIHFVNILVLIIIVQLIVMVYLIEKKLIEKQKE